MSVSWGKANCFSFKTIVYQISFYVWGWYPSNDHWASSDMKVWGGKKQLLGMVTYSSVIILIKC